MDVAIVEKQVNEFSSRFQSVFDDFKKRQKEEYITLLREWLTIIDTDYDTDARPFMKLILCNKIVNKLLLAPKSYIIECMTPVILNMEYVAENDYGTNDEFLKVFTIKKNKERFAEALIEGFNFDYVVKYLDHMLDNNNNRDRFPAAMRMLNIVIEAYAKHKEHKIISDFGPAIVRTYNQYLENNSYFERNTTQYIDAIKLETAKANRALGTATDEDVANAEAAIAEREANERAIAEDAARRKAKRQEAEKNALTQRKKPKKSRPAASKSIAKPRESWQIAQDKRRAELYDEAQRCLAYGDEAGYCGYMSALGDIGR